MTIGALWNETVLIFVASDAGDILVFAGAIHQDIEYLGMAGATGAGGHISSIFDN
jgi:hypothetical protein